jgi:hypothetical protein
MRLMPRTLFATFLSLASLMAADLRIGIIGTDTSHVGAFTSILNDPANPNHIPGARVVAAFKGGSQDLKESYERVDKYAADIQAKYGVEIVPDIATLLTKVDAVLLESVDGRPHLAQARQVIEAGKPLFIDKPLAASLEDARTIAKLASAKGVKWFSSSSLRYADFLIDLKAKSPVKGAIVWGPGPLEAHHTLDLSWYGIHAVEMLYTLMGKGCVEVSRTFSDNAEIITGKWQDGRVGTVRTLKPYGDFGAVAFYEKGLAQSPEKTKFSYVPLVKEIVKFFQTGQVPVDNSETLEMFAFMDAAQRSRAAAGKPMPLR